MHFFYPFIVIEVIQICLKDTQITKQTTQKAQNPISVWRISIVRISGFQHRTQTFTRKDEGDERSDKFLNRKRTSISLSSVTTPCTFVGQRGSISLSSVTTSSTALSVGSKDTSLYKTWKFWWKRNKINNLTYFCSAKKIKFHFKKFVSLISRLAIFSHKH